MARHAKSAAPRGMRCAAAISALHDPTAAMQAVRQDVAQQLEGTPAQLALLFVSSRYEADWSPLLRDTRAALGQPFLLGCSGGGIVGQTQEVEHMPAVSLIAAHLPDVDAHPFTVTQEDLAGEHVPSDWAQRVGVHPDHDPIGILLPNPFACDPMLLVHALGTAYPRMPLVGGLASTTSREQQAFLLHNDGVSTAGAIGVALSGNIQLHTLVAQGCRPIGLPYVITKAAGNVILELASTPAVQALQELFQTLSTDDQALAQRALFLGIVMNEQQTDFTRGDFVIRNLLGMDPSTGALAVGDHIAAGQTVQFQLRDATTSAADLRQLLEDHERRPMRQPTPVGGLLFTCLGRGQDLYGQPHYDIQTIQSAIGPLPISGFFCNGEIGPVGRRNYIHGFTSSLGLFSPKEMR